jgi:hypothetical protein
MIHVISLGAGVQSSTMALLAKHHVITPTPDCAIFADTGWEPKAVYQWLDYLEIELPFPVHRVGTGNLRSDQITSRVRGKAEDGERWASLPYYTDNGGEREGMIRRQCTTEYKIEPIEQFIKRELLGLAPRQRAPKEPVVTQWRGISADEAQRMKPSRHAWSTTRYPLAMELRMTRNDCLQWMQRHGYAKPPRSACIGCPYHSNHEWLSMQQERPEEFEDAVEFDAAIRKAGGMRGDTYLHRSCKPLGDIDFAAIMDTGSADLFGNECEGMCGV